MINCILCVDATCGIGKSGIIPWSIREDMQYFKQITTGAANFSNAVIMGRHTYESIGHELPNRHNYILSSSSSKTLPTTNTTHTMQSINNALNDIATKQFNNIFIIGGKQLYEHFINNNIAKYIYITTLNHDYECNVHVDLNLDNYTCIETTVHDFYDRANNITVNAMRSVYEKST